MNCFLDAAVIRKNVDTPMCTRRGVASSTWNTCPGLISQHHNRGSLYRSSKHGHADLFLSPCSCSCSHKTAVRDGPCNSKGAKVSAHGPDNGRVAQENGLDSHSMGLICYVCAGIRTSTRDHSSAACCHAAISEQVRLRDALSGS